MRFSLLSLAIVVGCSSRAGAPPEREVVQTLDWTRHVAKEQREAGPAYAFLAHGAAWNPLHLTWAKVDGALHLGRELATPEVTIAAQGFGRDGAMIPFAKATHTVRTENRVEIERGSVREWYVNGSAGMEQGFVIAERPAGEGALAIDLQVTGAQALAITPDDVSLGRFRVRGLAAFDADGKRLPTSFEVRDGVVRLRVEDGDARYPIDVDPLYVSAEVKLVGADSAAGDSFGASVSASGDVFAVGAPGHTHTAKAGAGAVYVFTRAALGTWSQVKVTTADGLAGDAFGTSVALSGTTLLVGAPNATVSGVKGGAAYAFVLESGAWVQKAKFKGGTATAGAKVGEAVAFDGARAIVGAPSATGGGMAYIFTPNTARTVWTEAAITMCPDNAPSDFCGDSVAINGAWAAVGAPGHDAGVNGPYGVGWVDVFELVSSTWTFRTHLQAGDRATQDQAGASVAIDATQILVGAPGRSSIFRWTRSGTTWTAATEIKLAVPLAGDGLGSAIALSGTTAHFGVPGRDDGTRTNVGAGFVYSQATSWTPRHTLIPAAGLGGDALGRAVAVSGERWIVGGPAHTEGTAAGQGVAYVFEFSQTKAQGAACAANADCTNGICADGVCCNVACAGCQACSAAAKGSGVDGVCGPVAIDTDPHDACNPDAGFPNNCAADGNCNGAGQCRSFAKAGTACGVTTCTAGMVTGKTCSGSDTTCVDGSTPCGLYVCDATDCKNTCAGDADCASGAYCTPSSNCLTKKVIGDACSAARECGSGFCADGVCCNAACAGQCESCNVAATKGTCSPVAGAPPSGKTACAGTGTPCAGSCDGANGTTCAYPAGTECSASCAGGTQLLSLCDASGACVSGAPQKCNGFACDADVRCRTTCSTTDHCAKGYVCVGGACEPEVAKCSPDGSKAIDPLGNEKDCAPYICKGGVCISTCTVSDDCAASSVCDNGTCVSATPTTPDGEPAATSEESGGCSTRRSGVASGSLSLVALAALGLLRRRRQR